MIRPALLAAALAACFLVSARAWDPLGHMLVGQIAFDQLTPEARAKINEALERFNIADRPKHDADYDFVTACCWMDDIRSRPEDKPYAVWHYVNLPFTPAGQPVPDPDLGPNAINGLEKSLAILTGKATDPAIDKDTALVIFMHLAGDIHQPLHATSKPEDAGGNKVKIDNLKDPLADLIFSKGGNLHFFWDSAYRRVYKDGKATVSFEAPLHDRGKPVEGHQAALALVRAQASAIEKLYPPSILKEQGDATLWAMESHALGYELGYQKLPTVSGSRPIRLGQPYVDTARATAQKRIAMAGYRLAAVLNSLFGAATSTPSPSLEGQ